MPKLPDKFELGGAPGVANRQPVLIGGRDMPLPDVGDALIAGEVLKGVGKVAGVMQAKQEEADDYEVQKQIVDFDLAQEKRLDDAKRSAPPEAKDFTASYRGGYDQDARSLMQRVPERLKPKVDELLVRRGAAFEKRAYDFELAERDKWNVQDITGRVEDSYSRVQSKPDSLPEEIARTIPTIRNNNRISAIKRHEIERKYLDQVHEYAIDADIANAAQPADGSKPNIDRLNEIRRRLKNAPREDVEPATAPQAGGPIKVESDGMAVIASGSGAKFRVGGDHATRFSGLIADLEASGIEIKPDQSGGYANRNIAGTNKRSEHSFGRAIDVNWSENGVGSKGAIVDQVGGEDKIRAIAAKNGLKWGGDFSGKRRDPMHFEIDPEAGPSTAPVPVDKRSITAFAGMGKGGSTTDPVERKELPPASGVADPASLTKEAAGPTVDADGRPVQSKTDAKDAEEDAADDALVASDAPEYKISAKLRNKMLHKLRNAMVGIVTKEVDDDIARLRLGRPVEKDEQGRTSMERARGTMTSLQLTNKQRAWDAAGLEHEEISKLRLMPDNDIADYKASIVDRAEERGLSVADAERVQRKADTAAKKIADQREKHPVDFVHGTIGDAPDDRTPPLPNTAAALKAISAQRRVAVETGPDGLPRTTVGPDGRAPKVTESGDLAPLGLQRTPMSPRDQWKLLFDARLADQRTVMPDKPDNQHRVLREAEGKKLLMIPRDLKEVGNSKALEKLLKEGWERAQRKFPPEHADRAFKDALHYAMKGDKDEVKANILSKVAKGQPITRTDLQRMRDVEEINDVSLAASMDRQAGLANGLFGESVSPGLDSMVRIDRAGRGREGPTPGSISLPAIDPALPSIATTPQTITRGDVARGSVTKSSKPKPKEPKDMTPFERATRWFTPDDEPAEENPKWNDAPASP